MPAPETNDLLDSAILWRFSDRKDDYNRPIVSQYEEVMINFSLGRAKTRTESRDAKSSVISYDATAITEETYPIDSILWIGELRDMPEKPTPLYQVKGYSESNDIKNRETKYRANLMRYTDTLPTIEIV